MRMYEEAIESLKKLAEIERARSAGVGFWQKFFWFFSLKGFAWKMANCCDEVIRIIKSNSCKAVETRDKLLYMLAEYSLVAHLRRSTTSEMFSEETQIIKEALFKM